MKRSAIRRKPKPQTEAQSLLRAAVRERSGGRCEIGIDGCHGQAVHLHHRRTDDRHESMTRTLSPSSVARFLDSCSWCHQWVHDHPAIAYEHGWLVHSWADPWHVPVVAP